MEYPQQQQHKEEKERNTPILPKKKDIQNNGPYVVTSSLWELSDADNEQLQKDKERHSCYLYLMIVMSISICNVIYLLKLILTSTFAWAIAKQMAEALGTRVSKRLVASVQEQDATSFPLLYNYTFHTSTTATSPMTNHSGRSILSRTSTLSSCSMGSTSTYHPLSATKSSSSWNSSGTTSSSYGTSTSGSTTSSGATTRSGTTASSRTKTTTSDSNRKTKAEEKEEEDPVAELRNRRMANSILEPTQNKLQHHFEQGKQKQDCSMLSQKSETTTSTAANTTINEEEDAEEEDNDKLYTIRSINSEEALPVSELRTFI